ncbi:MAG: 4Fe-4S binding protein [Chloroflexi bacterium]|nr:4Fe-4S binding protein [Chloroflexota bacterium]
MTTKPSPSPRKPPSWTRPKCWASTSPSSATTPHLTANGLCRICSVDAGGRVQAAACVAPCAEGMVVHTDSEAVQRGRRTLLEMLAATVDLAEAPEILALIAESTAQTPAVFPDAEPRQTPFTTTTPFTCVITTSASTAGAVCRCAPKMRSIPLPSALTAGGYHTTIGTFMNAGMMDTTCVFCGQCVGACPTGALKPKRQALLEQGSAQTTSSNKRAASERTRKT